MTDGEHPLTPEQIEAIKNQVLASVYEDIGRSLVKKLLWTIGAIFFAALAITGIIELGNIKDHFTLK